MKQIFTGRPLPKYEETFGHKAEDLMMNILAEKGIIVEAVEKGTDVEDKIKKVDFWLKLKGVDQPIGIQYTVTGSEDTEEKKIKQLGGKNWQAFKETPGTIGWSGKTDLILIKGSKEKLGNYYNKSLKMGVPITDVVGEEFVRNFFKQLLEQLKEFSPIKARALMSALQEEANKQKKGGRK